LHGVMSEWSKETD